MCGITGFAGEGAPGNSGLSWAIAAIIARAALFAGNNSGPLCRAWPITYSSILLLEGRISTVQHRS